MSISGDVQYIGGIPCCMWGICGGYHDSCGEYHEYIGIST